MWEILRWRDCLKFGPAERMHGVWYYGFEESGFVPNVRSAPLVRRLDGSAKEFDIYLDVDREQILRMGPMKLGLPCTTAIAIEFIGRQAIMPKSQHVRPSQAEVIAVDTVISARLVGTVRSVGSSKPCRAG